MSLSDPLGSSSTRGILQLVRIILFLQYTKHQHTKDAMYSEHSSAIGTSIYGLADSCNALAHPQFARLTFSGPSILTSCERHDKSGRARDYCLCSNAARKFSVHWVCFAEYCTVLQHLTMLNASRFTCAYSCSICQVSGRTVGTYVQRSVLGSKGTSLFSAVARSCTEQSR